MTPNPDGTDELVAHAPTIEYTYRDCFKTKTGYEWYVRMVMHSDCHLVSSVVRAGHAVYEATYWPTGGMKEHEKTREWLIAYAAELLAAAKKLVAQSCHPRDIPS